jgi:hemoglobin-like flavoprotein
MLSVYGQRHCGYGVTPNMLDLMAESFIVSFQGALEDEWSREWEEAWSQLFRYQVSSSFICYGYLTGKMGST